MSAKTSKYTRGQEKHVKCAELVLNGNHRRENSIGELEVTNVSAGESTDYFDAFENFFLFVLFKVSLLKKDETVYSFDIV